MFAEIFSSYPRIAQKVFGEPWAIIPDAHEMILDRLHAFVTSRDPAPPPARESALDREIRLNGFLLTAGEALEGINELANLTSLEDQFPLTAALRSDKMDRMRARRGEPAPTQWLVTDANRRAAMPYNMDSTSMIGQVNVSGIIGKGLSGSELACGGCCVDQIQTAVAHLGELGAEKIALHFNSPGGTVTGLHECASWLADFSANQVPLHAYTDTLCASAALYLALAADSFTAARTATIGSIGTMTSVTDYSQEWARLGRKTHLIASGIHKGQGTKGVPISEETLARLRDSVDRLSAEFFAWVIEKRGEKIAAEAQGLGLKPEEWAQQIMQGQTWFTGTAPRALYDTILPSRSAHLAALILAG